MTSDKIQGRNFLILNNTNYMLYGILKTNALVFSKFLILIANNCNLISEDLRPFLKNK
jgi:hypothetical protein